MRIQSLTDHCLIDDNANVEEIERNNTSAPNSHFILCQV